MRILRIEVENVCILAYSAALTGGLIGVGYWCGLNSFCFIVFNKLATNSKIFCQGWTSELIIYNF